MAPLPVIQFTWSKISFCFEFLFVHQTGLEVKMVLQQILDVSGWIWVLKRKTHLPIQFNDCSQYSIPKEDAIYVLVEANYLTCVFDFSGTTMEVV